MTKAELIRKLARKSGATDSEAKIFFEIFLQQCAFLLNPGEAVNIKGLGFFKFKKGKLKTNKSSTEENDSNILSDFIVYTPTDKTSDESDDLVFNIPDIKESEYNIIDSYFSLSIGKPVIPLRGVKNTEFFIPPAGSELRRLLESKAENLLSSAEIIREYIKGSEFLFITPETYSANQFEISWDDTEGPGNADTQFAAEKISWDFGEDISRQIEEDSLLDLDKEESITDKETGHVSWDFGVHSETEPEITEFEQKPEVDFDREKKTEEKAPEFIITNNFKRIDTLTNENKSKKGTEENLSWNFGNQKGNSTGELKGSPDLYSHYEEPKPDENGFVQVPNKKRTYDIELSQREQEKLNSIILQQEKEEQENKETDATAGFYKDEVNTPAETTSAVPLQKEYYSSRRSTPAFIIAIVVIVLIGSALLLFLKTSNMLNPAKEESSAEQGKADIKPGVIERNYDVPVTYPYPAAGDTIMDDDAIKIQKQDTAADNTSDIKPNSANREVITAEVSRKSDEIKIPAYRVSDGKSKKIKENLFREGNTYVVQLSSWKSKIKAQAEVSKLRNKGLAAFVEEVSLSGRGVWYRVKIGDFNSQSAAEKFLQ